MNLSLGSPTPCQLEGDVIDARPNVLFVIAAMNDIENLALNGSYPSLPSPNIICVAGNRWHDRWRTSGVRRARASICRARRRHPELVRELGGQGRHVRGGLRERARQELGHRRQPNGWGRSFTYWHRGWWSLSDSPSGQYANSRDTYAALTRDSTSPASATARRASTRAGAVRDDMLLAGRRPTWADVGKRITARSGTSNGLDGSAGSSTCPSWRGTPAAGWLFRLGHQRERD